MRGFLSVAAISVLACHGHDAVHATDAALSDAALADAAVCTGSSRGLTSMGSVVYDANQNIYWLADANLAATQTFGVGGINASGSMPYATAVAWVGAMNDASYLGHGDWQLATTPGSDSTCSSHNMWDFGRDCSNSAMGSLFYTAMGQHYPSTLVPVPPDQIGPFTDIAPVLYWTQKTNGSAGPQTFSFNNGQVGANTVYNFFYAWPMVPHAIGTAPAGSGLVSYLGGSAVYDDSTGFTWLADANLAATQAFGLTGAGSDGYPLVSSNGTMEAAAGSAWISAMNGAGYLGASDWQLPGSGTDLETLYGELGYAQGQAVETVHDCVGPFENLQPYLYWSCMRDPGEMANGPCSGSGMEPGSGFEWSFNFSAGFEGTDLETKQLYVMVYYPGT